MPPIPQHSDPLRRLQAVVEVLLGEGGCPWDREQTHQTLLPFLVEEVYELIEAIETGTLEDFREELGDVLLQVVFHARLAEQRGDFSLADVAAGIADKLVNRHPHVFGSGKLETAEEVLENWHDRKMKTRSSALEGVPSGQPALLWAGQIGRRAAKTGFEWESGEEILAKIREETDEIEEELHPAENSGKDAGALEEEVGDLFFAVTQLARRLKIDPEAALRRSTRKFITRFQRMEAALHRSGEEGKALGANQWRVLWNEAKEGEGR